MWRPGGGVGEKNRWRNSRRKVNYKIRTTIAGVITRCTSVVERDSSGVIPGMYTQA